MDLGRGIKMKLFKKLVLSTFVLTSTFSNVSTANEMEITAKSQIISADSKLRTYTGNVRIAFSDGNLSTKSSHATFQNGQTIMEGDVEIILSDAIAKTERVTFTPSQQGLIAKMDKVTFTYK